MNISHRAFKRGRFSQALRVFLVARAAMAVLRFQNRFAGPFLDGFTPLFGVVSSVIINNRSKSWETVRSIAFGVSMGPGSYKSFAAFSAASLSVKPHKKGRGGSLELRGF